MKLKNKLGTTTFNKGTLNLIEALIKPIMLFNGYNFGGVLNSLNIILLKLCIMCKQRLGVQKQTTNIVTLLELGRMTLQLCAVNVAIKNLKNDKTKKVKHVL